MATSLTSSFGKARTRTDQYGGDMVARTRYACEIIRKPFRAGGGARLCSIKASSSRPSGGQQDFESTARTDARGPGSLPRAAAHGRRARRLPLLHPPLLGAGVYGLGNEPRRVDRSPTRYGHRWGLRGPEPGLRHRLRLGLIGRRTSDIDGLAERVEAGEFDVVAVGRALIATPNWPSSWLRAAGRQLPTAAPSSLELVRAPAAASPAEVGACCGLLLGVSQLKETVIIPAPPQPL